MKRKRNGRKKRRKTKTHEEEAGNRIANRDVDVDGDTINRFIITGTTAAAVDN